MAETTHWRFAAPLWKHPGNAAWHFVTLPFEVTDEIDEIAASARKGFGSVRVDVQIGASAWSTSLFPDSAAKSFVLPVKRAIRTAERIVAGDRVEILIRLADPVPVDPAPAGG
jgi:hypothetical protein